MRAVSCLVLLVGCGSQTTQTARAVAAPRTEAAPDSANGPPSAWPSGYADDDRDADGVQTRADLCPGAPEDRDGFADGDGCPEEDNDGDGIADVNDQCPDHPETADGFEDTDGCPDGGPVPTS